MTDSSLIANNSLKNQRQALRHQRRLKAWQGVWRFVALCGMTGGLVVSVNLPHWLIEEESQIEILGNERLHPEQIHQMLEIPYPQLIWKLPIHHLTEKLQSQPPLETVYITRKLLPVQVQVMVRERKPVAEVAIEGKAGFVDASGVWIPKTFYQADAEVKPSVQLKALGFNQKNLSYWQTIYPLILSSPVKIKTIDWRDPSNLILHTALGKVHFGTYLGTDKFAEQLTALGKLSPLTSKVKAQRIIYIDLSNTDEPSVHLKDIPDKTSN
ncbi:MAG: FtsQ-type POTRA domain-containing protein [Crocosphaera sp.]|nr:FtsQ-type POTRA domain-containing protein [Crocosphaera sp.]